MPPVLYEEPVGGEPVYIAFTTGTSYLLADLNCDEIVNTPDLVVLLSMWGECADPEDCRGDQNHDGMVDVNDLILLLNKWGWSTS